MNKFYLTILILLAVNIGFANDLPTDVLDEVAKHEIHTLLVYEDMDLKWEYYDNESREFQAHEIHSCTKSIVSLLVGTLYDKGKIKSLKTPVYKFFKDIKKKDIPKKNRKITLEHILTMTTGLDTKDSYLYNWEGIYDIWNKEQWTKEILNLDVINKPGTNYDYSNLTSFLLGRIVAEVSGMELDKYAEEVLFNPLGITGYVWDKNKSGEVIAWGTIKLKPKDLAKIGQLVLNNGVWNGKQLISEKWLKISTKSRIKADTLNRHYAYHWWVDEDKRVMALGYQGQYLIIDRYKNSVTVFNSQLKGKDFFVPYNIFVDKIVDKL